MAMFTLLALSVAFIGYVQGDFPVNWDRDLLTELTETVTRNTDFGYRLPANVIPIDYDVDIEMFFQATADKAAYSYDGKVVINVQVVEEGVTQIVLHENVDQLLTIGLTTADGTNVPLNPMEPFSTEAIYHFLKINPMEPLVNQGYYVITITYRSTMNNSPMRRGIWRGRYVDDDGTERNYALSHFQPYSARQAFPCFDEPALKAIITLHITRPTSYSATFANMPIESSQTIPNMLIAQYSPMLVFIKKVGRHGTPGRFETFKLEGNRIKDTFYPTPRMSVYLLSFLVSEGFVVLAESDELDIPVRIIGRPNGQGAQHSLDLAVSLTKYFEELFNITYAMMDPNMQNDHIASPDWASAGTENWGLVGYRELYLLHDPLETPMDTEQYIATLVSHEIVHSWFGNWATCFWWSNTWINEGYASYFGYMGAHAVAPQYNLDEHFNWRYLQASLASDSAASSSALNHEVNSPAEVTGHFGTISYSKGAALLRMIEDLITTATFHKANEYFLKSRAFEPANQHDLYVAFVQAVEEDGTTSTLDNFDMYTFFETWVDQPGYPVINVDINYETGEMNLSQERFYLSRSVAQTDEIWPVPITYTTGSNPDFDNVKSEFILSERTGLLTIEPGHEWVIVNVKQRGHYRVNYDDHSWDMLSSVLQTEPDTIHFHNRAQIVDDVFALMRSGRISYLRGFNILSFLKQETNYHVWDPAISGFTWLRNRFRHLPAHQAELDVLVLSYMEHAIEVYGYDVVEGETTTETLTRLILLAFACNIGHQGCISDSLAKFQALKNNQQWVSPHLRRHVFTVGIREGTYEDYQFLLNRMLTSNVANDDFVMLRGLGASKDPSTITEYLHMTLDTNIIRPHDSVNAFNMALLGNNENARTALQFLKENIDTIRTVYVAEAQNRPVHTIISNTASYLDEDGLAEMEEWLQTTQTNTAEYATGISAINSARNNQAWGTEMADEIIAGIRNNGPILKASSLAMVLVVGVCALLA